VQVLTRDGWVFVNPYLTLVTAYERLIGGRGTVVRDSVVASASAPDGRIDGAADATIGVSQKIDGDAARERNTVAAEHCVMRMVRGHRRQHCWTQSAQAHGRARHARTARPVDHDAWHENQGPQHDRDAGDDNHASRHIRHTGHARTSTRHGRA